MTADDQLERAMRAGAPPAGPLPDLSNAAAEAGLLGVAYATLDSPVGTLLVALTPRGLVRVAYVDSGEEQLLAELAARVSPRVIRAPRRLDEPRRELDQYFAGKRREFELPLDWQLIRGFGRKILSAAARVPYGSVSTYKKLATEAGSPRAARAAGNALGANPLPILVPCHRILHSGGGLGGYTGGLERKRRLLAIESGQQRLA
jgi:methylated-DNA-[protein]-cysteine S-methyltransferase